MLLVWLLRDVHPPLYPAVLKLWIAAFGPFEHATRALSELPEATRVPGLGACP